MDSILIWLASMLDSVLNLAGLLLWLYWRALGPSLLAKPSPISLAATLQYGGKPQDGRWVFLAVLAVLLGGRPLAYWHIGSAIAWVPTLRLGVVDLTFRSDFLGRMALFSLCSFGQFFVGFYLWLLFLSALNGNLAESDPMQKRVRLHLGWLERGPALLKLMAPLVIGGGLWLAFNPLFTSVGLLPPPSSGAHLGQQALVVGVSSYLSWKLLLLGVLLLHLINAYVFLGNLPLWNFLNATAQNLLGPLRRLPLRLGRVDLSPLVGVALVLLLSECGARALTRLFLRLPL